MQWRLHNKSAWPSSISRSFTHCNGYNWPQGPVIHMLWFLTCAVLGIRRCAIMRNTRSCPMPREHPWWFIKARVRPHYPAAAVVKRYALAFVLCCRIGCQRTGGGGRGSTPRLWLGNMFFCAQFYCIQPHDWGFSQVLDVKSSSFVWWCNLNVPGKVCNQPTKLWAKSTVLSVLVLTPCTVVHTQINGQKAFSR